MSKLLSANFARLMKNRTFWKCMAAMAAFGVFRLYMAYFGLRRWDYATPLENLLFGYANIIGIAAAAFVSMFLGTEYSDGTMRNKLIMGHGRCAVYLSELIVNGAAVLLLNLCYVAVVWCMGIPLIGNIQERGAVQVLALLGISACTDMAFAAIFTLLGMLRQSKTSVAVISLVGAMAFIMISAYIRSRVYEPEVYEAYMEMTDKGYVISRETEVNPSYVSGTKRQVFELLCDLLPTGQSLQIGDMEVVNPERLPIYSALIIVVSTGLGIFVFRRKDIR